MNAADGPSWTTANQAFLAAEFAALRLRFGGDLAGRADLTQAQAAMPSPPAIDQLAAVFALSPFERQVLLLAAGVEMDAALAAQVPRPSFGLALGAFDGAHWSALAPLAPLRAWHLLEPELSPDGSLASISQARLRIDERILHLLAGINQLDARLLPLLREHSAPELMAQPHADWADSLGQELAAQDDGAPQAVVALAGNDADGRRDVAWRVARHLGLHLFVLAQADVPGSAADQDLLATLWQREALLLPAALFIESDCNADTLSRFVQRLGGLVFVGAPEPVALAGSHQGRFDKPGVQGQRALWQQALGAAAIDEDLAQVLEAAASQFSLSATEVTRRVQAAAQGQRPLADRLWQDCREAARTRLDGLAQRVPCSAGWHQLVLPPAQLALLRQIAAQVRQRVRVYGDWGFEQHHARGLGISALFHGESGVGKTLACEVLAHELDLDLYRIDLSSVVSKYIGETEKNLRAVFDAAEASGAILLFDEADALFGKRSEVKDSHDRYANIEVSYLLQRMESYRGLAVLTSNQRAALDPAFTRRLRFIVQFPFPDAALRESLWRGAFPAAMPLGEIDYPALARLQLAGGQVRNIALNAAFLAADAGQAVSMDLIAQAARHEAAKHDRNLPESQTKGWAK